LERRRNAPLSYELWIRTARPISFVIGTVPDLYWYNKFYNLPIIFLVNLKWEKHVKKHHILITKLVERVRQTCGRFMGRRRMTQTLDGMFLVFIAFLHMICIFTKKERDEVDEFKFLQKWPSPFEMILMSLMHVPTSSVEEMRHFFYELWTRTARLISFLYYWGVPKFKILINKINVLNN
jgi:hypothetical protein